MDVLVGLSDLVVFDKVNEAASDKLSPEELCIEVEVVTVEVIDCKEDELVESEIEFVPVVVKIEEKLDDKDREDEDEDNGENEEEESDNGDEEETEDNGVDDVVEERDNVDEEEAEDDDADDDEDDDEDDDVAVDDTALVVLSKSAIASKYVSSSTTLFVA